MGSRAVNSPWMTARGAAQSKGSHTAVWFGASDMLTVSQIAAIAGRSRRTIIRWFETEPDVFVMDNPETLHKRRYRTLRIPRTVLDRVMQRRLANGER